MTVDFFQGRQARCLHQSTAACSDKLFSVSVYCETSICGIHSIFIIINKRVQIFVIRIIFFFGANVTQYKMTTGRNIDLYCYILRKLHCS